MAENANVADKIARNCAGLRRPAGHGTDNVAAWYAPTFLFWVDRTCIKWTAPD